MPHSIWKGTMGFGLVSIAVELLPAETSERLDLDMLDRRDKAKAPRRAAARGKPAARRSA